MSQSFLLVVQFTGFSDHSCIFIGNENVAQFCPNFHLLPCFADFGIPAEQLEGNCLTGEKQRDRYGFVALLTKGGVCCSFVASKTDL